MTRLGAAFTAGTVLAAIAFVAAPPILPIYRDQGVPAPRRGTLKDPSSWGAEWEAPRPQRQSGGPPAAAAVGVTEESQAAIVAAVRKIAPAVVGIQVVPARAEKGAGSRPAGSGVIIDSRGHVLTNARVIDNAARVRVVVSDEKVLDAEVVGKDERRDLAVLKIAPRGLTKATLGRSRSVPVGTWVVAVGRATGGQISATVGVLSARDREILLEREGKFYAGLLQTDAAINPDNSGGPLVNLRGEVVGISTIIRPDAQGLGFAIASEVAAHAAKDLIRYHRVRLAWLGIQYQDLNAEVRRRLRLGNVKGIVVSQVLPGTPAQEAGLRDRDIIVAFDRFPIQARKDFRWHIMQARPGQKITLKVLRRGRPLRVQARLSELSEE